MIYREWNIERRIGPPIKRNWKYLWSFVNDGKEIGEGWTRTRYCRRTCKRPYKISCWIIIGKRETRIWWKWRKIKNLKRRDKKVRCSKIIEFGKKDEGTIINSTSRRINENITCWIRCNFRRRKEMERKSTYVIRVNKE